MKVEALRTGSHRALRARHAALILMPLLISLLSPAARASVVDLQVIPEDPIKGDTVKVIVRTSSMERVDIGISYEMELPVSGGKYEYRASGVRIPAPPNHFTVRAANVKNLRISIPIRFWIFTFWITRASEASNGIAILSQEGVPAGTYDAIVQGDALDGAPAVELQVSASKTIVTDSNGYYEYSYDTGCIPPGTFTIRADEATKVVTLRG
jgi:hypothetical protein